MNLIKFDGWTPPVSPTNYSVNLSTVKGDDSFTTETGVRIENVIRDGIFKIAVSYNKISSEHMQLITAQILKREIQIDFFYGEIKTAKMMTASRDIKLVTLADGGYWDVSFSLEEF